MARAGILTAVIGVFAAMSLAGVATAAPSVASTARVSAAASQSSLSPAAEGHTKCVPWPKSTSVGLKCTGTYSGTTAWNPWTWQSIPQQPVVTVSQTKDLTDQGVQINWSDLTPTLDNSDLAPNTSTSTPLYSVAVFECEGTNPDLTALGGGSITKQCFTPPVGSSTITTSGLPPNAVAERTADTSLAPRNPKTPAGCTPNKAGYPSSSPLAYTSKTVKSGTGAAYCKSSWDGGNPADWTGQADFHVEAPSPKTKGNFFNCASGKPCSLVIVPNFGGTPVNGSWTDTSRCGEHHIGGGDDPRTANSQILGEPGGGANGDFFGDSFGTSTGYAGPDSGNPTGVNSVEGDSAACWVANRIVIPLSFAPKASNCPNKAPEFYAAGSPMMQTQMLQWQAGWCVGHAPVTLNTTFSSEPQARSEFLTSSTLSAGASTDMALTTLPVTADEQGASTRKFTYAPLANSGAGIAYEIDDNHTASQINRMVLDPRLLAKLFTESYTLNYGCTSASHTKPSLSCDPAVWGTGNNPVSLYQDPEFLALNKHCQPYGLPADYTCRPGSFNARGLAAGDWPPSLSVGSPSFNTFDGDFLPTVLAQANDMTYDLTDWIASDPDTHAFLNGSTDTWGQRVNTDYLQVSFPTELLAVQDQGFTQPVECGGPGQNPCGSEGTPQDVTMQAAWNPVQDLNTITGDLLTDLPTAFSPLATCPIEGGFGCTSGSQFSIDSPLSPGYLGQRDLLSELDLGDIASYQFPAAELVNAAGSAVTPTQASVEAAVNGMKTNPDGITQYVDYGSTSGNQYPLAMVDYAMVPTCGLSHTKAAAIADFLTKAATTGQRQGEAPGELGPGYYPLTAKQKAKTLLAAKDVKDQTCKSPPPDRTVSGRHGGGSNPGGSNGNGSGSGSDNGNGSGNGKGGSPSAGPSPLNHAKTEAYGQKSGDSGLAGLLLLLAIIIGVLLVLGGPTAWVITVTGRWPAVIGGVRAIPARLQAGLGRLAGLVIRRA